MALIVEKPPSNVVLVGDVLGRQRALDALLAHPNQVLARLDRNVGQAFALSEAARVGHHDGLLLARPQELDDYIHVWDRAHLDVRRAPLRPDVLDLEEIDVAAAPHPAPRIEPTSPAASWAP